MGLKVGPKVDTSEGSRVDNHSEGSTVDLRLIIPVKGWRVDVG